MNEYRWRRDWDKKNNESDSDDEEPSIDGFCENMDFDKKNMLIYPRWCVARKGKNERFHRKQRKGIWRQTREIQLLRVFYKI